MRGQGTVDREQRTIRDRIRAGIAVIVLLLCAGVVPSAAQSDAEPPRTPASEEVAKRSIGEIRSPYCPGLMLEVCPSPPAEFLRDSIHMLAAQGASSGEIVEWMIANHGEEWRAVPKRSGAGLWAWILPPLALLFGAGVVVLKLRKLREPAVARAPAASALTEVEREQLAAALAEWEHSPEEPS
ncbi:hypothetical protein BH23GEM3_BH23GEM3_20150 [soil metagenome]